MLFSDQRKHSISIPSTDPQGQPSTVRFLVTWLCDNLIKDPRKDMFVLEDSVYVPIAVGGASLVALLLRPLKMC
jgi:ubiquitin related modifier 1